MMTGEVLSIKDSSDERQAPREEATKEDKSSEREVKTDNTPSDQSNYADTGNPAIYFDPFKPSSGGNMPPKKSRTD